MTLSTAHHSRRCTPRALCAGKWKLTARSVNFDNFRRGARDAVIPRPISRPPLPKRAAAC